MQTHPLKTLSGPIRLFPWVLPLLVTFGLLSSMTEGLGIGLLIPFLQQMMQGTETSVGAGPLVRLFQRYVEVFNSGNRLFLITLSIVGLVVLKAALVYTHGALSAWANGQITHTLRKDLFRQLFTVGFGFIARRDPGHLLNTLTTETWRAGDALGALSSIVISCCTILVFTVLLLLISWQLTVGMVAGVVLAMTLVRLVMMRARRFGERMVQADQELSERCIEGVYGMRMIRAFGQEAREQARYARASEKVRRAQLRIDLALAVGGPLMELLFVPLFLGALLIAWRIGMGIPTVIAFLLLLYRLQPLVGKLASCRMHLAALSGALSDIHRLMEHRDKPGIHSGPVAFRGLSRSIAFDEVSFGYGGAGASRPALDKVSFEIAKGRVTAIVGGSGAGKSTLVNLLFRFYDPVGGRILIDGRPLPDLELTSWRARLSLAGQDVDLLGGTIAENIAYGTADASRLDIARAAVEADADGFISHLPEGYDTPVGDRGIRLSGGQRQRISLARALLRNPEVLILDEATNALDSESEAIVQRTLERLAGRLTMIIIAHRLSTIRNADHVVVLDGGRMVERGSPEELLRNGGALARLYDLQVTALTS